MTPLAFATVAAIHLLAAISPGPAFVLSLKTAAAEGMRAASGLALGYGIGAALWAAAALAGLSALFDLAPVLFTVLKVAGGAFLIWMAIGMWRLASEPMPVAVPGRPPRGLGAAIRLGVVAMLANPKPAVFFGAVFVGLVPAQALAWEKAMVVANVLVVETAWYLIVARAFSLPRARAAYGRLKTLIDRSLGVALGLLGARIALP